MEPLTPQASIVRSRRSVRAHLERPVPRRLIEDILDDAPYRFWE